MGRPGQIQSAVILGGVSPRKATILGLTGSGGWRWAGRGTAKPVRIQYPGAVYHVMARGNQGREVFRDNNRHEVRGHLFQGLYKAIPMDGRQGSYFQAVSTCIQLNPARGGVRASFPTNSPTHASEVPRMEPP